MYGLARFRLNYFESFFFEREAQLLLWLQIGESTIGWDEFYTQSVSLYSNNKIIKEQKISK